MRNGVTTKTVETTMTKPDGTKKVITEVTTTQPDGSCSTQTTEQTTKGVRQGGGVGPNWFRLDPIGTNPGLFQIILFQYTLARRAVKSGTFSDQISVHFGS